MHNGTVLLKLLIDIVMYILKMLNNVIHVTGITFWYLALFTTSRQHLTHQLITTFDNDVGMLSYTSPMRLTEVGQYDNWSLQKLKVKEEPGS